MIMSINNKAEIAPMHGSVIPFTKIVKYGRNAKRLTAGDGRSKEIAN